MVKRYPVAFATEFQVMVGINETLVALFAGKIIDVQFGIVGVVNVLKLVCAHPDAFPTELYGVIRM